ncbi:MAG: hypothetical protein H7301_07590 [Cryobacterium sp.]|nr:hypothetical protein [Oligoflexia bacterium]
MTKKMIIQSSASALLIVGAVCNSGSAHAAGFEKSLTWSAASAAQAGAVVGSVAGADSLYYNPAGLAGTTSTGAEVSLNFSPTFSKFSGANPLQYSASSGNAGVGAVDGKGGFSPVGGMLASYKLSNQLAIGGGFYVSGGTKSKYEGLDYSAVSINPANLYSLQPVVETSLAITEAALGAGYEVIPGLRFGAAWRVVMVNANFSTVGSPAAAGYNPHQAITNVNIDDIKATRWNAYKLGLQYDNAEKTWGIGAQYRSEVKFTAKSANTSGQVETAATNPTALTTGFADLSNTFPQQVNLGGYVKASPTLRVSTEYSYTNYSKDKVLVINGTVNGTALSSIPQYWKNQHIGRLGFEYTGYAMPIRFGYAYTSQVTPSEYARSTFASPGSGHAIAIGSGMPLMANLDFDFAGEYSFASGTGHNIIAPNPAYPDVTNDAEFKSHAYVAHLSAKYHF